MRLSLSSPPSQEAIDDFCLNILVENTNVVAKYLEAGMPVAVRNSEGLSPLQISIFEGCVDISLALIDRGAPCTDVGRNGGSLLHDGSWSGRITNALLDKKVATSRLDAESRDAFYRATQNGSVKAMRSLASAGCSVSAPGLADGVDGVRPIHAAASSYDLAAALTILDLGGSVLDVDAAKRNVLHYAAKSRYVSILAEPDDFENFVKAMQSKGVDIDAPDDLGRRPLHYAAQLNDTHQTSVLLKLGANPRLVDNSSQTAEDIASINAKRLLANLTEEPAAKRRESSRKSPS